MPTNFIFHSDVSQISSKDLKTAFANLYAKSPSFRQMIKEIERAGESISINIHDGSRVPVDPLPP